MSLEFLGVSAAGALPWIVPAALAIASMVRRRAWRDPAETPWVALAVWAVGVFAVFAAIPFKLPHYALPAYPALALLAMRGWRDQLRSARALIAVHALLIACLAAGCAVAARGDGSWFRDLVFSAADVQTRKEAAAGEAGSLPPWAALQPVVARSAAVLGLTSAALVVALALGSRPLGAALTLAGMLCLMPSVKAALGLVASGRAVAGMAAEVRRAIGPGDVLVHEGPIESSGAIEFYSGHRPALLDGRRSVLGIGATFADAAGGFWDADRFRREWTARERRLVLLTPRSPAHSIVAALPPESVRLLQSQNGRRLYDNAVP